MTLLLTGELLWLLGSHSHRKEQSSPPLTKNFVRQTASLTVVAVVRLRLQNT